ncbi:MAG: hypothetical protein WAL63_18965 [Solirubrobacteraceae bacterium]
MKSLRRQRGTPSDADLLKRARRDPSAFSELYTRHVGDVHAWLLGIARNVLADTGHPEKA